MKGFKYLSFLLVVFLWWNTEASSHLLGMWKKAYIEIPTPPGDSSKPKKKEGNESHVQKEETERQTEILPTPKNIKREVTYDYKTNLYMVTEKVNGVNIKPPMYMTYEEYLASTEKKEFADFVESKNANQKPEDIAKKKNPLGLNFPLPANGVFGEGGVEIKPQGNLDILMGYQSNTIRNPALTPIQQTQSLIDFDMGINVSVMGKIGDKFQNTLRYNNQNAFGFEGQRIRLAYNGKEDEIIRNLEAGDISFEVPTQLIKSANSLWGVKSELQFGKLNIKTALSQQRSTPQSRTIENGKEIQNFEITVDQYDQFRHFFLCHMFRDHYEKSLENYPMITSPFQVTNVEVWVSNRSNLTQSVRDVATFQDLGEPKPFSSQIIGTGTTIASNDANDLYGKMKRDPNARNVNTALQTLISSPYNLVAYRDFEKGFLRKLNPNEFTLNTQLGYISLNSSLQPNDILAVSFQYVYKGQLYQVGDLTRDVTLPDTSSPDPSRLLFLKTLKGTNINPSFPMWHLMMKNVYSLNAFQISPENFRLDIFYNDPGAGVKRYLPKGSLQNEPLIRTLNVDRLNLNNEPYPDGVYDFVPNITILPANGKIYFPVLEPFGSHLKKRLENSGNGSLVREYVYQYLYDSTQFIAQQYPELNRFLIKGTFQSSTNKRIPLGLNTPKGSVYVTMNGQRLTEGVDYIIEDGSLGYVELMDHVMNSGGQIRIEYENNMAFGLQVRNFLGARAEYRFNDRFKIGTTYEKLSERPFNNKISYGDDPISNQIIGGDISYAGNLPFLTRLLDKLPFYKTSEMSTVNAYAEYARLIPGHYSSIGEEGTIFIDDFEAASINYGFGNPAIVWRLASTPKGAKDASGRTLFPESAMIDSLPYGFNRAKLSWYNIANTFFFNSGVGWDPPESVKKDLYNRNYEIQDVYPGRFTQGINNQIQTLDLSFYPEKRGPYNYEFSNSPTPGISSGINSDGTLKDPKSRWAGIQRSIENTNFEVNNIEFIQFWMLDPFIYDRNNRGDMYFNLGFVSEDVLKDSRLAFEQGLVDRNGPSSSLISDSRWSWVPKTQPLINGFSNEPNTRQYQDVGLDGVSNENERIKFADYLQKVRNSLTPAAYSEVENDPSSDDFKHYLNSSLPTIDIVGLYEFFGGVENNTPVITTSGVPQSNYATPDNEDINRDNTLNENEAYFQYRLNLYPGMDVGNHPYIVSKTVSNAIDINGIPAVWYQMRIPIKEYSHREGEIGDFRNIQFVRMFLTNFEDKVTIRMVDLSFVRNQWRKYTGSIQTPTDFIPRDNGETEFFDLGAVSLEENSRKTPVSYVTPPGMVREVGLNASSNPIQLNEQSLRLSFCNLKDGDAKACFKNINFDFRQYKKIRMFAHAENNDALALNDMKDGEVSYFVRLGNDFKDNYYEYEIPLKVTPPGNYNDNNESDKKIVWPDSNEMVMQIADMVKAKLERNKQKFPTNVPFVFKTPDNKNITILGNPDLGMVKVAMVGVRNRAVNDPFNFIKNDDGLSKCGEVWVNELRLEGLNEQGGSAAIGNLDVKLADLGTAQFSSSFHTAGYGQIYERVNERKRDDYFQYNFTTSLQLGRLLPKFIGLQLPFYLQTGRGTSQPQFDPYSTDVLSEQGVDAIRAAYGSDSAAKYQEAIQTIDRRFGFNFTNVRYMPAKPSNSAFPLALRFFSASYSFNSIRRSSPFVKDDWMRNYMGNLSYNYAAQPKYIEPFKKLIKSKKRAWDWVKAVNFNLIPNSISFTNQIDRSFGVFQQRQLPGEAFNMPEQFIKNFTWNRNYGFDYNPFRPLNINFTAANQARIDEPQGRIDTKAKEDSLWRSIRQFGRTTAYNHTLNAKYNLPLNKVPALEFMTASINYGSGFQWTTGPQIFNMQGELIQSPQGNIITNNQSIGTNVNIKMAKIYNKIPVFKNADIDKSASTANMSKEQKEARNDAIRTERDNLEKQYDKIKEDIDKLKKERKNIKMDDSLTREAKKPLLKNVRKRIKEMRKQKRELSKKLSNTMVTPSVFKAIAQPLMAVRDIDASYNIENTTSIAGYTQKPRYFGIDFSESEHLDPAFVLGMQPGIPLFSPPDKYSRWRWLDDFADRGFMTKDTTFNQPFTQTNTKRFKARVSLEPWRDIRISLNWESDYSQNFTEFFIYNPQIDQFEHRNPLESGSYTYSDINLFSSFKRIQNDGRSQNITELDRNRQVYAQIFQQNNPNRINQQYIDPMTGQINQDFWIGYGPLQQDVLVNSFLTTYRGERASGGERNLSPFSRLPLPNWNIQYNGLTKFPVFKKMFEAFTIKHGYSSRTTIANFNSDFRYEGGGEIKNPIKIDSLSNNFIPLYVMPNIGFNENFSPLLGIDFTLKNKMNFRFEFKRSRMVSMSLIDYQLTENVSSGFTFGYGFQTKPITLPFSNFEGKNVVLKNGARISCDVSYTDNFIVNHRVGQDIRVPVGGAIRLMINPKVDVQVNEKFNMQLFYNYVYNEPRISNSFPMSNGAVGMRMSFSLAP
ncbi:MAG: cell surface protein SprA [Chitinophagales bacterium]|nr:cell surface protein SprA [Chitinophagales bacterium]